MSAAIQRTTGGAEDLPALMQLGRVLAGAGGMVPDHLSGNPGGVVAIILAGRELGLGPMAAMRGIALVKGRVTLGYQTQLALCASSGVRHQWVKQTAEVAHLVLRRLDGPDMLHPCGVCGSRADHECSLFSMEDAKRARLSGDNWSKYPKNMLRARATSNAVNSYCPEVLMGATYTPGEVEDDAAQSAHVQDVTAVEVEAEPEPEPAPPAVEPVTDNPLVGIIAGLRAETDVAGLRAWWTSTQAFRTSNRFIVGELVAAMRERCVELGIDPAALNPKPAAQEPIEAEGEAV